MNTEGGREGGKEGKEGGGTNSFLHLMWCNNKGDVTSSRPAMCYRLNPGEALQNFSCKLWAVVDFLLRWLRYYSRWWRAQTWIWRHSHFCWWGSEWVCSLSVCAYPEVLAAWVWQSPPGGFFFAIWHQPDLLVLLVVRVKKLNPKSSMK